MVVSLAASHKPAGCTWVSAKLREEYLNPVLHVTKTTAVKTSELLDSINTYPFDDQVFDGRCGLTVSV